MAIKPMKIDGREIPVEVDEEGLFFTNVDGDRFTAPTFKALDEKVCRHLRTYKRVNIPATLIRDDGGWNERIIQIVLTGIHSSNRNVLYREDRPKASTDQLRFYNSSVYQRLTMEQIAEYKRLCAAQRAAGKAVERWEERYKVNANKLIEEAQAKLAGEPQP